MTRTNTNTEQEQAEFEAQFKHLDLTQEPDAWGVPRYKHAAIWLAWEAWQAALRAPVPPPGYRLQPLSEYDAMCAFIAATAPQPSEGLMTTEAEATPVQMPEPAGWRDPTNLQPSQGCTYMRAIHEKWPHIYREPLYTEQQVRAMLAIGGQTQADTRAKLVAHHACKPDMLVNGGALKLALNVLRRAGKNEVADELEATAVPQ